MDDELTPDAVAVRLDPPQVPAGFPRPAGWRPAAPLLLLSTPAPAPPAAPRWRLRDRHRAEDASTADIRSAEIRLSDADTVVLPVVLKFQRADAAYNASREAIEGRLNREHRALRALAGGLPPRPSADLPQSLQPDGTPRGANEAMKQVLPLAFCLAANHAIPLPPDTTAREDLRDAALRAAVGSSPACADCRHANPAPSTDGDPVPPACRPWLVARGESGDRDALIAPPVRLLILTDQGQSLQQYLDTPSAVGPTESVERNLIALEQLAETLQAIHDVGWLHLDLNLDNVCRSDNGRLRLIDFGHAERFDAGLETFQDRIPLRRVDFAAPETQLRHYPLKLKGVSEREWEAQGLVGWPRGWWPARGDRLDVTVGSGVAVFRIDATRDDGTVLRLGVTRVAGPPVPAGGTVDAVVYRTPGATSDLYSFGLLAICLLTGLQKPVLFRNEVAVFERGIAHAHARRSAAPGPPAIDDDSWLSVYRGYFSRYSWLLDDVFSVWERRIAAAPPDDRERLWFAVTAGLRVAVKCLVRDQSWGYAARGERPFAAVLAELSEVRATLAGATIPPRRTPISLDQFASWVRRVWPQALPEATRRNLRECRTALAAHRDALARARADLDDARRLCRTLREAANALANRVRTLADGYRARYGEQTWFARRVRGPLRALFRRHPAAVPDGETERLAAAVAALAWRVPESDRDSLHRASDDLRLLRPNSPVSRPGSPPLTSPVASDGTCPVSGIAAIRRPTP